MKEQDGKKGDSYIREHLVPKKSFRKVLLTILGVVALALVFGVVSGVAFSVSRNLFGREESPTESPIIIIPRASSGADSESDILKPDYPTEATRATNPPETEASSAAAEGTEPADPVEQPSWGPTEPESLPVTLQSMFASVSSEMLQVILELPAGEDWFHEPQTSRKETVAVPIAENQEAVFFLTDAAAYTEGASYHVYLGNEILIMEPYGVDSVSKLAVLRIPKELIHTETKVLLLGVSTALQPGDRVFLIGATHGHFGAQDEGRITSLIQDEGVADGYRQLLYTNMLRTEGGSAVLFNEDGEIVGWVSDVSAGAGFFAIATGISSIADAIQNLYRGEEIPYFGVVCRRLTPEEAAGSERKSGLYVQEVLPRSPAFSAGIQPGDRIISIDLRSVFTNRALQSRIYAYAPGTSLSVLVGRQNNGAEEELALTVTLGVRD